MNAKPQPGGRYVLATVYKKPTAHLYDTATKRIVCGSAFKYYAYPNKKGFDNIEDTIEQLKTRKKPCVNCINRASKYKTIQDKRERILADVRAKKAQERLAG